MITDTTILIKTFERKNCLVKLLESIKYKYPNLKIIIADDSENPLEAKKLILTQFPNLTIEYLCLPFNVGLSEGRNKMLEIVDTQYFLLCDDDFVFDERTKLGIFQNILEKNDIDLVGGLYYDVVPFSIRSIVSTLLKYPLSSIKRIKDRTSGSPRYFFGMLKQSKEGTLILEQMSYHEPYVVCDLANNFFLAKTEKVRNKVTGWDPKLKVMEHKDFFYRAKMGGLKVAHTNQVGVLHVPYRNIYYNSFRYKKSGLSQKINKVLYKIGLRV